MIRCKHCGKSELGAIAVEVKKTPIKLVNGEPAAILGEAEITQDLEITYCFTCNKPITQEDIIENETCPICGKVVPELVDGKCSECADEVNKLLNMSKEELILMMLKGQMSANTVKKEAAADVVEEKKEGVKKTTRKKTVKTTETTEVTEETNTKGVLAPMEEVNLPKSEIKDNTVEDVTSVKDEVNMPPIVDDEDSNILDQLDSINVGDLNLQDDVVEDIF